MVPYMSIKENVTITIDSKLLDDIRKIAEKEFRSINKQLLVLIVKGFQALEQEEKMLDNLLKLQEEGKL